jgi:bacterioferritin (cytochrome b1)
LRREWQSSRTLRSSAIGEDNDLTSRRMMEDVLAKEEEHAEDLKTLLERVEEERRVFVG